MKKSIFTFLFFFLLLNLHAQHTVTLSGTTFSPDDLTINVGETVTWDNQSGFHNVNGSQQSYPDNPESFANGAAANAPWMFSHTFTLPGVYDYQCDIHFGMGMVGKITVMPAAATDDVVITEINYNSPGLDDYEYVELYNNGPDAIDMEGWTLTTAVDFVFPAFTLDAGGYVVIANNATAFEAALGFMPFQFTGALNNNGENIVLSDANGGVADMVAYSASSPWPGSADGSGPSLSLCDVNADNNDVINWAASITPTGFSVGGTEILATPGAANECPTGPVVGFLINGFTVPENAGNVFVTLILSSGNANATQVTLEMDGNSTANNGDDFTLALPVTVTFDAGVSLDTQVVNIGIVNDSDIESVEALILNITNPTNGATISPGADQYILTINDDDAAITNALIITGVYDAQPAGAGVKGIELRALADIADLSIFGVGSASNGGGSDGVEITLPAISATAGDCIYVANDSTQFMDFFGSFPMATGTGVSINGDDAIELFENNTPIDVFGEITYASGSTLPWSYLDGWAYRKDGTGPDGTIFQINNWTFSGENALDDQATNATAAIPFPECEYSSVAPTMPIANNDNASTDVNTSVTINVLANDQTPNSLTSMTVTTDPTNGTVTVNGVATITYTPNTDFCGTDSFVYEICDLNGCDEATVIINVACPPSYPAYNIATVTTVDATGHPDSLGVTVQLQGIVHGIDFQGGASIQFALIDATGGISVFSSNDFGYTVTEGDELIVQGTIAEFSCLTQITPDTLWVVSTGNALQTPTITAFLNESFESEMVKLTNLNYVDVSQWLGNGSSFDVMVTNGSFTNLMRIDSDSELSSMPAPQAPFHATGIGGQFDNSGPCDAGYQFLPRYAADIEELNNVIDPSLAQKINFYPNPVNQILTIDTDLELANVRISNLLGQVLVDVDNPHNSVDVSEMGRGIYLITFQVGEVFWTDKLVKE